MAHGQSLFLLAASYKTISKKLASPHRHQRTPASLALSNSAVSSFPRPFGCLLSYFLSFLPFFPSLFASKTCKVEREKVQKRPESIRSRSARPPDIMDPAKSFPSKPSLLRRSNSGLAVTHSQCDTLSDSFNPLLWNCRYFYFTFIFYFHTDITLF